MTQQELLLARQPILNIRLQTVAYELLCRPIPEDSLSWQLSHGDRATGEVLISAFNDLGIEDVTGGLPAFINFTEYWLKNPPLMPAVNMVAELLEHIEVNETNINALRNLRTHGYQIALDDFHGSADKEPLFPLIDIVKIDIRQLTSVDQIATVIQRYAHFKLTWLAEKVETQEEYDLCRDAGCTLFQGYFFSRPANVYGKRLPDNALAVIRLLKVLNQTDANMEEIATVVKSDPQLSYKLLKIINSASVGYARKITSISQAIIVAGINQLKAWASLISLGRLSNKPQVLREQAVIRAYLAKAIAAACPQLNDDTAFTLGLFSLLDAFFDHPLVDICKKLNLSGDLANALLNHQGDYGFILATVIAMEQATWDNIDWQRLHNMGITAANLELYYLQSLQTAQNLLNIDEDTK